VAEEPDYRLRIVYHMPQVEILDRRAVKGPERLTAGEVVPNMDKVSGAKPEVGKKIPPWLRHSATERFCFKAAGQIAAQRSRDEELSLTSTFSVPRDFSGAPPEARHIRDNRERFEGLKTLGRDFSDTFSPGDVLAFAYKGGTGTEPMRIPSFSRSLGKHLAKAGTTNRGDVMAHSFLVPLRHIDETTGMQSLKVGHESRLTALGGHH